MKHIFKLWLAWLIYTNISACAIAQGTPVSAGGDARGSGGTVSYSVGEVAYTSKKSLGGVVIEGIQQGYSTTELPISLLEFSAFAKDKSNVLLSWETASETNNKYFEVERSSDGRFFSKILSVDSKGNGTITQAYNAVDPFPLTGISFYRLKQIDIDGKSTYSKSISINIASTTDAELKVYPNPITSILNLQVDNAVAHQLVYALYTIDGKLVSQQKINSNTTTISTSGLVSGTYLLQVKENGNLKKSFKIIKN